MWSATRSKLMDLLNVFYCFRCNKKLQKEYIFGCKHAFYCRDCYSVGGLQCKLNIYCEIIQLERFQAVLNLCESLNLLINQDYPSQLILISNELSLNISTKGVEPNLNINNDCNDTLYLPHNDYLIAVADKEIKNTSEKISSLIQNSSRSRRKCKSLFRKYTSPNINYSTPKKKLSPKNTPELASVTKKLNYLESPKSSPIKSKYSTGKKHSVFTPRREYSARKLCNSKLSDLRSASSPKQIYSRNMKGETLLHVACIKGELDTVKKLLEENFDPNVKDFANWTPLHEASNHGYASICELLIQHGALVDACGDGNCTPLHDAIINSRLECVKILLENGASITQRNSIGMTALDLESTNDIKEVLKNQILYRDENKNPVNLRLLNLFEEKMPDEIIVTTSGFDEDIQNEMAEAANKLGWKFTNTFVNDVTHVIAKLSDSKTCKRTLKTMSAILLGRWIVTDQWIKCSLKKLTWVEETKFLIKYCGSTHDDLAPAKSRLAFKRQLPQLFNGCNFFVNHNIQADLKDNLIYLIKMGGGLILQREPKIDNLNESISICNATVPFHVSEDSKLKNCSYFVISNDSDFPSKSIQNVSHILLISEHLCRVNASWIFDCISKYKLIDEYI